MGNVKNKDMKKFNDWLFMSLLLYVTLSFTACSTDEEILPEFPEKATINGNANSEATFSFNANMDWRLSSNKTCFFANGRAEYFREGWFACCYNKNK